MEDMFGTENECLEPDPFLASFVVDTPAPNSNDDPLMKFVLRKDDSTLPNKARKSDNQGIDTVAMTTSLQANPSSSGQPLTGNSSTPSKKRTRDPDNPRTLTPEPINPMLLTPTVNVPAGYGEAKKPKTTRRPRPIETNASSPLLDNFRQNIFPRGKSPNVLDLEINGLTSSTPSLPRVEDFSQIPASQSSGVPPLLGFCGATTADTQFISISQVGGSEFNCNEEASALKQIPSVNPPSVVLSSEGFSDSPFSASTFSEDDTLGTAAPGSSQNCQENQSQFYCLATSQANDGSSSIPLEFSQLEGLGHINGAFLDAHQVNPTFSQNTQIAPNSNAKANTQVLNNVSHMNTFAPRPHGSSQIISGSTSNASCKILNPKKEYDKNQKKLNGPRRSEQRIQGGKVKMKIATKLPLSDLGPIELFVRREPTAAMKQCHEHPEQFTMEMTRFPDVKISNIQSVDSTYSYSYKCDFDLDSVYLTTDGKEVYKLVKSKGAFNNRFQLLVHLRYVSGHEESLIPYEFVLKSGRTPTQQDNQREKHNSGLIEDTDGPRAHYVSCRHLDAETAKITNIHCENIQTENHDIAYFIRIKTHEDDVPSDMEKGDVVVFLEDEEGDTYIDFLTSENARDARLAGVISRTAFVRGRTAICDPEHVDCDLVCIIGEVEVKVVGKVQAGDLIYTSNGEQYRGSAVARHPLELDMQDYTTVDDIPIPTLLGMAMESDPDPDIKLVRCLVSIVLGISDLHQRRTLEELRNCHDKIVKIQKYLRGIWKKGLLFLVFFLVVGIMCYLFLAPNSPYLIMKCEKGCKENSKGSCQYLKFYYIHEEAQESDEIIGVLFNWSVLKDKLELAFNKCPNHTKYRYYLNKSRCVTGGIRAISAWLDPAPRVPRVNVFAVSPNCRQVFYYSGKKKQWKKYQEEQIIVKKCDSNKISR